MEEICVEGGRRLWGRGKRGCYLALDEELVQAVGWDTPEGMHGVSQPVPAASLYKADSHNRINTSLFTAAPLRRGNIPEDRKQDGEKKRISAREKLGGSL